MNKNNRERDVLRRKKLINLGDNKLELCNQEIN